MTDTSFCPFPPLHLIDVYEKISGGLKQLHLRLAVSSVMFL